MALVRRFPLLAYFALAYAISGVALAVIGPPDLTGAGPRNMASLAMFPVMVIGVGLTGVALTAATAGREGLRGLRRRLTRWRLGWRSAILLLPPLGILLVLSAFRAFVSPRFTPHFWAFGIGIGLVAGCCEELGWTGFAYPRLSERLGPLPGALLLGVLWGLWHFPVVDSLGAASPHGHAFLAFFASFVALVTALRVLIAWLYRNTGSILGAQLLHASSTGFLVALSPLLVSPAQEALWYFGYAALLWLAAAVAVGGPRLVGAGPERRRRPAGAGASVEAGLP